MFVKKKEKKLSQAREGREEVK